jgi:hypothetical protein
MLKPSRIYTSKNRICYDFIFKQAPKVCLRCIVIEGKLVSILWERQNRISRKGWSKKNIE